MSKKPTTPAPIGKKNPPAGPSPSRKKLRPGAALSEPGSTLYSGLQAFAEAQQQKHEGTRLKVAEAKLADVCAAFDVIRNFASSTLPAIKPTELSSRLREATAVAMLSDVHAEEEVRATDTPWRDHDGRPNIYNLEVAHDSIGRFFAGTRWLIGMHRQAFKIRNLVLWLGGDLMSGHIHEELKFSTALTPLMTLPWLIPRLQAGIDQLLADSGLEKIHVVCSYGNHGRTTYKPFRARGAEFSYEWVLYKWLASLYEGDPRIEFDVSPSAHQYLTVYDWDLHFHHGDECSYMGGVGGIMIPLNKAIAQWDKAARCHYHHFGHWHQYLDAGRIVVNGSVIGFNAYAMSIKAEPEPPRQAFYLLDSRRGKTCSSPIWVRAAA